MLKGFDTGLAERKTALNKLRDELTEATDKRRKEAAAAEAELATGLDARREELGKIERDFTDRLKLRREEIAAVEGTLAKLAENRATIVSELGAAGNDIVRLREEREAVTKGIAAANAELVKVRTEREALIGAITTSRGELEELTRVHRETMLELAGERDKMIEGLRKETPVTAVTAGESVSTPCSPTAACFTITASRVSTTTGSDVGGPRPVSISTPPAVSSAKPNWSHGADRISGR